MKISWIGIAIWLQTWFHTGKGQQWPLGNFTCQQLCEDGEDCLHVIYTCSLSVDKTLDAKTKIERRCSNGHLMITSKRGEEKCVALNTRTKKERGMTSKGKTPIEDTITGSKGFQIQPGNFQKLGISDIIYVYLGKGVWMYSLECEFIKTMSLVNMQYFKVLLLVGDKPTACNHTTVLDRARALYEMKNVQKVPYLRAIVCPKGRTAQMNLMHLLCFGAIGGTKKEAHECKRDWKKYGC